MVEISSDDDLVEMSVAASPQPSSVSVFTHRSRLLLLRSVVAISYITGSRSIYPTKGKSKNIQAADASRRHSACTRVFECAGP